MTFLKETTSNHPQPHTNTNNVVPPRVRRIEVLKNQIFPLTDSYIDKQGNTIQLWSTPGAQPTAVLCGPDGSVRYISSAKIRNALNPQENPVTLHNRLLKAPDFSRWDFVIKENGDLEI